MVPPEMERRRPVWDAMSDLFLLETETRRAIPRLAFVLAQSDYSAEELGAIWDREIVPECAWNLSRPSGSWSLFVLDEERLALRADGQAPPDRPERSAGVVPDRVREQWRASLTLRGALSKMPDRSRATHASAWTAFVHVYLERALETMATLEAQVAALRVTGASEAELVEMFEDIRPTLRGLLTPDELPDEQRRAVDVRVLIGLGTS